MVEADVAAKKQLQDAVTQLDTLQATFQQNARAAIQAPKDHAAQVNVPSDPPNNTT